MMTSGPVAFWFQPLCLHFKVPTVINGALWPLRLSSFDNNITLVQLRHPPHPPFGGLNPVNDVKLLIYKLKLPVHTEAHPEVL